MPAGGGVKPSLNPVAPFGESDMFDKKSSPRSARPATRHPDERNGEFREANCESYAAVQMASWRQALSHLRADGLILDTANPITLAYAVNKENASMVALL
jgi:hypothetical protein